MLYHLINDLYPVSPKFDKYFLHSKNSKNTFSVTDLTVNYVNVLKYDLKYLETSFLVKCLILICPELNCSGVNALSASKLTS